MPTAEDADCVIKSADLALYRAKADGRGTYRFFDEEMDHRAQRRRALEMDLRQAIANEELALHYQPLVDIAAEQIIGVEALVRWRHPRHGTGVAAGFHSHRRGDRADRCARRMGPAARVHRCAGAGPST